MVSKIKRRFLEAKRKHRPKLQNWERDGFGTNREQDFLALRALDCGFTRICDASLAADRHQEPAQLYRISCSNLSYDEFIRYFERPALPCIIADVPTVEEWPAASCWTSWAYFHCMRDSYFKVGEDDDGYSVKVTMACIFLNFMRYLSDSSYIRRACDISWNT